MTPQFHSLPRRTENRDSNKHMNANVHGSSIHRRRRQPQRPPVSGWMDEHMWSSHTWNSISHGKEIKELRQAMLWKNLENTMLGARSQTQKVTYCRIQFMWHIWNRKCHGDRTRLVAAGEGSWGRPCLTGVRFAPGWRRARNRAEVLAAQHWMD